MNTNDIIAAVTAAIQNAYPGEAVYTSYLPSGFERPSFAIECRSETATAVNVGLVLREITLLITCFAAVDDAHDSDRLVLNSRQSGVLALFERGYMSVGDRAPKVRAIKGDSLPDCAEVSVSFSIADSRAGYADESDPGSSTAAAMENYAINNTAG